jgi:hypothetical protein
MLKLRRMPLEGRGSETVLEECKRYTFQGLGLHQREENFTYAIEHCKPSYNYNG